ncbi:uncharacterized protein LOC116160045 [Photinus pyralis]|uniref:uncharacterized protein LOC116160045 n=1 Tax=Photinus pyralis TaxID=7054 RepID=UPI001267607A|nr:uncharacterized protein LOC116160045 [Photinus pyralis]
MLPPRLREDASFLARLRILKSGAGEATTERLLHAALSGTIPDLESAIQAYMEVRFPVRQRKPPKTHTRPIPPPPPARYDEHLNSPRRKISILDGKPLSAEEASPPMADVEGFYKAIFTRPSPPDQEPIQDNPEPSKAVYVPVTTEEIEAAKRGWSNSASSRSRKCETAPPNISKHSTTPFYTGVILQLNGAPRERSLSPRTVTGEVPKSGVPSL